MPIIFTNVNVSIQNSGILAESASIEQSVSLTPAYSLGMRGVCDQPPAGNLKTNITLNYTLKTDIEPNYQVSSGLRGYSSESPVVVHVGGLSAYPSYLESYSLRAEPNQLVKASASYVCYIPLVGTLQDKLVNLNFSGTNNSGVAHSWALATNSSRTLGFGYSFFNRWEPVYSIGNAYPVTVLNHGGSESFTIARDTLIQPTFSGTDVSNFITPTNFNINSLNIFCGEDGSSINLDMSNAKIVSASLSAQTKDIVRTSTELIKYH